MLKTWKLLEHVRGETKCKLKIDFKALRKLFTLNILTKKGVYIKCHNLLKPQNRLRVRNASKINYNGVQINHLVF